MESRACAAARAQGCHPYRHGEKASPRPAGGTLVRASATANPGSLRPEEGPVMWDNESTDHGESHVVSRRTLLAGAVGFPAVVGLSGAGSDARASGPRATR